MPYISIGRCVYKRNPDGSKGERVGCTKGSVKDYIAALHANVKKKSYSYKVDRKMKNYGELDEKKKIIRINPKKGEVVNSAVHEDTHKKHLNKPEKWIKKKAEKRERNMSIGQIIGLLGKFRGKKPVNRVRELVYS